MAEINKLSATDTISAGDLLALFVTANGDSRKASITLLTAYLQGALTFTDSTAQGSYVTQYSAPSSTGFNVTITDGASDNTNVHLILTPTGTLATGTITLPPVGGLVDKQEVLLNSTQEVTTLTVAANGATGVIGEPSTLAANDFFRLKFDLATKNWYRVG